MFIRKALERLPCKSLLFQRTILPVLFKESRLKLPQHPSRFYSEIMAAVTVDVDSKNPPGITLLMIEHLKEKLGSVSVNQSSSTQIQLGGNRVIKGDAAVSRYLANLFPDSGLYGGTPLDMSQVDSWIDFSNLHLANAQDIELALNELDRCLAPSTFFVGSSFTMADFAVWNALRRNSKWANLVDSGKAATNVNRWFKFCNNQSSFKAVAGATGGITKGNDKGNVKTPANKKAGKQDSGKQAAPNKGGQALKSTMEEGGKFFDLPGAEMGKVVTRFPPEASGYLHIGHAKAALMNQYYKDHYNGKLVFRFDDTNPAKENAHFEQIIEDDIKLLHLTPDVHSRTSDHFEVMQKYAEQMIQQGDAYCDNTPAEEMKRLREERLPSPNRDLDVAKNMALFEAMKKGTPEGMTTCLRAKIDYASDNGCLRDPVLYRCRDEEHLVHGSKYKAYPTYDFACPIVDSVEGVTHALRTLEYLDRDAQYYWLIEKLGIRKPYIYSYSRLNLISTVLSKRKLTYLVDEGYVDGWDDPRMPTVRGVLRRGMTIDGLKEFIVAQGSSKSTVHMGWDKIWSFNKKVIDPIAPRYNALLKEEVVPVLVQDASESSAVYPVHPKDASIGEKNVYYSKNVWIEGADAQLLKEGEMVTFINWGNLCIQKIIKDSAGKVTSLEAKLALDNKDFKKTLKITWLSQHSEAPLVPTKCSFFEHIIAKDDLTNEDDFKDYLSKDTRKDSVMLGDPCLKNLKKGDIIQLQRRGYFICDEPYEEPSPLSGVENPCVLFHIPDGSNAGMMNKGKEKGKKDNEKGKKDNSGSSASKKSEKKKKK